MLNLITVSINETVQFNWFFIMIIIVHISLIAFFFIIVKNFFHFVLNNLFRNKDFTY